MPSCFILEKNYSVPELRQIHSCGKRYGDHDTKLKDGTIVRIAGNLIRPIPISSGV